MRILLSVFFLLQGCLLFAQKSQTTLLFDFGNTDLTQTSQLQLPVLLQKLKTVQPSEIWIKGHTDKKGSDDLNDKLSESRAAFIANILRSNLPAGTRLIINSYGADSLLSEREEDQFLNRRVEIIFQSEPGNTEQEITDLQPLIQDVEEQRFVINLDDTIKITANTNPSGTRIRCIVRLSSFINYQDH